MRLTPKEHVTFQHPDGVASALVEVPKVLCSDLSAQVTPNTFAASDRTALPHGLRLQLGSSLQNAASLAETSLLPTVFRRERPDQRHPRCRRYLSQIVTLRLPPNRRSILKFEMPQPLALPAESRSPCIMRLQHCGIPGPSDSVSVSA
jgi:hypothetical protein